MLTQKNSEAKEGGRENERKRASERSQRIKKGLFMLYLRLSALHWWQVYNSNCM